MKVSTRTRYGLRLLIHLASQAPGTLVNVKEASRHEGISAKYLEQIIRSLKKAGMLLVARGAHGGYAIGRPPEEITVLEVFQTLEDGNLLIDCVDRPDTCDRREQCSTFDFWVEFQTLITDYLGNLTIADLVRRNREKGMAMMFYI
jgi:Rrf2 family protein